jgi:cytidylate kinase
MPMVSESDKNAGLKLAELIVKAALRARTQPRPPAKPRPFVTVSREPGAGGTPFSHRLAERLNAEPGGDWAAWGLELVEKISAEAGIARELVQAIEDEPHSWVQDLLEAMSARQDPQHLPQFRIYQRVAVATCALAQAGHAIIVGRGGMFITARIPGGIHLRLVAPLDYRIKQTARQYHVSESVAADRIAQTEANRAGFFARYWPGKVIMPQTFALTLNSAALSLDEMVDCVLPLIRRREANPSAAGAAQQVQPLEVAP